MPNRQTFLGIIFAGAAAPYHYPQADRSLGEPAPLAADDSLVRAVG
jgi:hypothetical protein